MKNVLACIDGGAYTASVCDYAAWSAQRLGAPLQLLHVIDRQPERALVTDLSGSIGLGTQETLLAELAELDESRSKLAQEHGREILEAAQGRARAAGVPEAETLQRNGALVDTLLDMQAETRLVVLGQHPVSGRVPRLHLDHNVERVVRSLKRPVLVCAQAFAAPGRFLLAFDGSATGRKMVEAVAGSPLLRGLPCHVVMVGEATPAARDQLEWARTTLQAAGFAVQADLRSGEAEAVLCTYVSEHRIDLLVMGAYGHSRIRELIVGSTTTTLLRTSPVPVLILR